MSAGEIWAMVPVKNTAIAKQRLAPALPQEQRQALALAMLEDVLSALAGAPGLARRLLVTIDPAATRLAARYGFDCILFGMMLAPGDGTSGPMSNRLLAVDPTAHDTRVPPFPYCQALLRALPELGGGTVSSAQYDRYILGMRVLGRVLLSAASVETTRRILLASTYTLLGLIGLLAAWRFVHARGDPEAVAAQTPVLALSWRTQANRDRHLLYGPRERRWLLALAD